MPVNKFIIRQQKKHHPIQPKLKRTGEAATTAKRLFRF